MSWIEELGERAGPMAEPARVFLRMHAEGTERGADAIRALTRALDAQLDDEGASEEDDRRFVEGAGALLGLTLVDQLGGGHASRDGAHRVHIGMRGFFDPFAAVEAALDSDDSRKTLAAAIRAAEAEARDEGPASRVVAAFEQALTQQVPGAVVRERFELYLKVDLLDLEERTEVDLTRIAQTTADQPPAAVERAVDKLISLLPGGEGRAGVDLADARVRLLPRLVKKSFLDELVATQAGRGELAVTPLGGDTFVALVLSYDGRCRYVRRDELLRWELGDDDARRLAIDNLATRSGGSARFARVETDDGPLVVARSGDGLDSARLLLPGLIDVVGGELGVPFIAAVPHRDALLLGPSEPESFVEALKARARDDAAKAPHPITDRLFVVSDSGVQVRY